MNYNEIERLKSVLTRMVKEGCHIHVPAFNAQGKVIGIGFKPYWTNPVDSKIEKLQLSFLDSLGRVVPFNFYNVIGYNVVSQEGDRAENSKSVSFDIHVYDPNKQRGQEPYDKVRIDFTTE